MTTREQIDLELVRGASDGGTNPRVRTALRWAVDRLDAIGRRPCDACSEDARHTLTEVLNVLMENRTSIHPRTATQSSQKPG